MKTAPAASPLAKTGSPPAERIALLAPALAPPINRKSSLPGRLELGGGSVQPLRDLRRREFRGRDRRLATVRRLCLPAPHNPIRPSSLAAPPPIHNPPRAPRDIPASASNRSSASHHFIKQRMRLGIRSVDGRTTSKLGGQAEAARNTGIPLASASCSAPGWAVAPSRSSVTRRPATSQRGKYRRLRAGPFKR